MPKNSFAPLLDESNHFTRRWAGTLNGAVDPYVTGYHFIKWAYLPAAMLQNIQQGGSNSFGSPAEVQNFLQASCLSVTLPSGTLNKAEFNGLGNVRYAVPTNVDYDNTFTIRFLEFSGTPVLSIFHGWVRMIRDYRTGASALTSNETSYTKSNYAASLYYWTTQPNGKFVEEYELLTGVFPQKDPRDQYGHDLSAIDKLEVDIDFNVDYMWHEQWVRDNCQNFATQYSGNGWSTVDTYGRGDAGRG